VDDGALRVHITALRKALKDGSGGNRFIINIPGQGYTFAASVAREQRQEASRSQARPLQAGNLPNLLTRVVGRDDIIASVISRLPQHRLLTLVGPGGIGKTTVAIAAAEALNASFADGVWFAGLSEVRDASLVSNTDG
jgi:replication-associated recombination protein RarA